MSLGTLLHVLWMTQSWCEGDELKLQIKWPRHETWHSPGRVRQPVTSLRPYASQTSPDKTWVETSGTTESSVENMMTCEHAPLLFSPNFLLRWSFLREIVIKEILSRIGWVWLDLCNYRIYSFHPKVLKLVEPLVVIVLLMNDNIFYFILTAALLTFGNRP